MTALAAIPATARRPLLWAACAAVLLPVVWWATLPDADSVAVAVTAPASPPAAPPPMAPPPPPPPPAAPASSPDGLKLHGVLGGHGPNASAIIGRADGRQMLVRIGRAVLPGLVLTRIERDAAILEQGGSAYRLSLVDGSGASRITPVAAGQGCEADDGAYARKNAAAESVEFRQAFVPHRTNGQITGYAIRPGVDVDLFRKARLRPGDIVTTINGRPFASEAEVNGLAREISVSAMLEIGYERDGVHHDTRINIAQ